MPKFVDCDDNELNVKDEVKATTSFSGPIDLMNTTLVVEGLGRKNIKVSAAAAGYGDKTWTIDPGTVRKMVDEPKAKDTEPTPVDEPQDETLTIDDLRGLRQEMREATEPAAEETVPVKVADDFQSGQHRPEDLASEAAKERRPLYTMERLLDLLSAPAPMPDETRQQIKEQFGLVAAPVNVPRTTLPGPGIWEVKENGRCTPLVPRKTEAAPEPVVLKEGFVCVVELDEEPGKLIPQGAVEPSKQSAAHGGYMSWFSRMIDKKTGQPTDGNHYVKVTEQLHAGEVYDEGHGWKLRIVSVNIVLS